MPLPRFSNLDEPRRQSILAAAADEFAELGFAQASYNRIIARAGISKGAMYYYFADKEDLFRTVLDAALAEWMAHVGDPFRADDADSFWAACRSIYVRSLQFMLADPRNAAMCLSITRARARLEGHPALLALQQRMQEWVGLIVGYGQQIGAVRTDLAPELLVEASLAMMDAGDRWLATRWETLSQSDVEPTADTMVGLFKRVGAPEAKHERKGVAKRAK